MFFVMLVILLALSFVVGWQAENRGRSLWMWFFLGMLMTPLVSYLLLRAHDETVRLIAESLNEH